MLLAVNRLFEKSLHLGTMNISARDFISKDSNSGSQATCKRARIFFGKLFKAISLLCLSFGVMRRTACRLNIPFWAHRHPSGSSQYRPREASGPAHASAQGQRVTAQSLLRVARSSSRCRTRRNLRPGTRSLSRCPHSNLNP